MASFSYSDYNICYIYELYASGAGSLSLTWIKGY